MNIRPISIAALHREFQELTNKAVAWDQTFEHAKGTYPTSEFVENFRSFATRLDSASKQARYYGPIVSYELSNVGQRLDSDGPNDWQIMMLEGMAKQKTPYSNRAHFGTPWTVLPDPVIDDLRKGERLLYAKLITMEPDTPKVPNPGVPSGTPGTGPRPTPIPGA